MKYSTTPSVRDVYDALINTRMWAAWLLVFFTWLGGSISIIWKYGFGTYDAWYLIYLTGLIGVPSGFMGFDMLRRILIKQGRMKHKMRSK